MTIMSSGCPLLYTQIFTLIIPETQTTLQMQTHTISLTLCYCRHIHTHNIKWMQVAISFCSCHTKCGNLCQLFIFAIYCKVFIINYYMICLCFIFYYNSVKLIERYSILQNVSLFCFCSSLIRLHKESHWVASYVHTQHLNRYSNVLNLNRRLTQATDGRLYAL